MNKLIVPLTLYIITSLIAFSTTAQTPHPPHTDTSRRAADTITTTATTHSALDTVTVTATRTPYTTNKLSESLRLKADWIEIPQNIHVTTAQTMQDIGALSTTDVLRTASGVLSGGARQDITINIRGSESNTSILRNGVGSGYWYNMEADVAMLERAEFIKGPAGFMISNTEPGGMVNLVTKQPTHERIQTIDLAFGSWNLKRLALDLGGEFKKDGNLTYRLNAGVQDQNDFYQFGYLKKYFIATALKYEPAKNTSITFEYNRSYGHQLSDGQYLPTVNGHFFALPSTLALTDPNTPGVKSNDNYFRLQVNHTIDKNWQLYAQAAYVFGGWGGFQMGMNNHSTINDTLYRMTFMSQWDNSLATLQAYLSGTFNTGEAIQHQLLAGIDWGKTTSRSYGGENSEPGLYGLDVHNPTYYIPTTELKNFDNHQWTADAGNQYEAVYVQDQLKIRSRLIVTLAARYTTSDTWASYNNPYHQTDHKLTPRLGLTWLFNDNLSAYAVYDEAFVPQSGRSFSGELFKPLTGNNQEIGIKGFWLERKLSASLSLYQLTKNDALTLDPEHPNYSLQTGQTRAAGVELDINGAISKSISIMANYAYTNARVTKDNDPAMIGQQNFGSAKNIVNVFLRYGWARHWSIGSGVQYIGQRYLMPDATLLEATLGYTAEHFSINLNAYNLTDCQYVTYASPLDALDLKYMPGQPVNFRVSLKIRF